MSDENERELDEAAEDLEPSDEQAAQVTGGVVPHDINPTHPIDRPTP